MVIIRKPLLSTGFQNWKSALKKFRTHECSVAHKSAVLTWKAGQQTQTNPERNVVSLINQQKKRTIDENRQYLKNIVETLIFLGIDRGYHYEDTEKMMNH